MAVQWRGGFSTLRLFDMDSDIVVNVGWCRKEKMTKGVTLIVGIEGGDVTLMRDHCLKREPT